jgi:hypothetical protein
MSPSRSIHGGSPEGSRAGKLAMMMGNESHLNRMSTMGIMKRKPSCFSMVSFFPPSSPTIDDASIVIEEGSNDKSNNKSRLSVLVRQKSQSKESLPKVSYSR